MSNNLRNDILNAVKKSKYLKCKRRAKKAHRIKHKKNPYPKYSYNSGLCKEDGTPVWGIDIKWSSWEIKNGNKLPDIFGGKE